MINSTERQLKKQSDMQRRQLVQDVLYRTNLRRMNTNQQSVHAVMERFKQRAVEAENNGNHKEAVHFAQEALHMQRQLDAAISVRETIERAHAISENSKVLAEIMRSGNELMGTSGGLIDPSEMMTAQVGLEMTKEQLSIAMEQQQELMDSMDESDGITNEEGEEALRRLMQKKHQAQVKSRYTLENAKRRLDEIEQLHRGKTNKEEQK